MIGFMDAVRGGKVVIETRPNANFPRQLNLVCKTEQAEYNTLALIRADMPEVWEGFRYEESASCLLYRTNGEFGQFVVNNPDNPTGACSFGRLETTIGPVNVDGGWSGRPSLVHMYMGHRVVEIIIDYCTIHVVWELAQELAKHMGLKLAPSKYSTSDERDWAFYKKGKK